MKFDEQQLQAQAKQVTALKEELSSLNFRLDTLLKENNTTLEEVLQTPAAADPELRAQMARAEDAAKRAGAARVAQSAPPADPSAAGRLPGARRSGIIRL